MSSEKEKTVILGGTVAAVVTCPLEVVKTRMQGFNIHKGNTLQMLQSALRNEGVRGLFRGLGVNVLGTGPTRAVYFMAYHKTKDGLLAAGLEDVASTHGMSALGGGVIAQTFSSPLWVVKTRMQLQDVVVDDVAKDAVKGKGGEAGVVAQPRFRNGLAAAGGIYRAEGLRGFFKGVSASYLGLSETITQFVLYERLNSLQKEHFGVETKDDLSPMSLFASASVSKLVASLATYPHEVVRTRLRQQDSRNPLYKGLFDCFRVVARTEGWRALYGGMPAHLIRVVPSTAITFLTYELVVREWLGIE